MDALISLSGNVGTDIEYFQGEGWAYARFRMACTPRFQKQGEWIDGETTWVNVRCTNRTATNVRDSLGKGDPVVVTGKLRTHVWKGPEGERHDRLVVEAVSLGHDLTRGASSFTRNERAEREAPTPEQAEAHAQAQQGVEQQQPEAVGV